MAITKDELVSFIENMTVLELSTLVKELEEKFGVTASAPMVVGPDGCSGGSRRRGPG